jgi:hypothetical protein
MLMEYLLLANPYTSKDFFLVKVLATKLFSIGMIRQGHGHIYHHLGQQQWSRARSVGTNPLQRESIFHWGFHALVP